MEYYRVGLFWKLLSYWIQRQNLESDHWNVVLGTLKSLPFPTTFIHAVQNPNIRQQFQEGHPYDPEDPGSLIGHEARFPLIMGFPEERKATLFVAEVATRTIQYDFWFYGSELPAWINRIS